MKNPLILVICLAILAILACGKGDIETVEEPTTSPDSTAPTVQLPAKIEITCMDMAASIDAACSGVKVVKPHASMQSLDNVPTVYYEDTYSPEKILGKTEIVNLGEGTANVYHSFTFKFSECFSYCGTSISGYGGYTTLPTGKSYKYEVGSMTGSCFSNCNFAILESFIHNAPSSIYAEYEPSKDMVIGHGILNVTIPH